MKFIRHTIADMDESMVQHCVICSEIISDYRNVLYVGESPKGWPAGSLYVTEGNPKFFTTTINEADLVIDCMNPFRVTEPE